MIFGEQIDILSSHYPDRPSRKKPMFPVNEQLRAYLKQHGREVKLPVDLPGFIEHILIQFLFLIKMGKIHFGKR